MIHIMCTIAAVVKRYVTKSPGESNINCRTQNVFTFSVLKLEASLTPKMDVTLNLAEAVVAEEIRLKTKILF